MVLFLSFLTFMWYFDRNKRKQKSNNKKKPKGEAFAEAAWVILSGKQRHNIRTPLARGLDCC